MLIKLYCIANLALLLTVAEKYCMYMARYKGKRDVVVDCVDETIIFNSSIHNLIWQRYGQVYENKYPYTYLNNGSLHISNLKEDTSYFFCQIWDKSNKTLIHRCATAVKIIYPLYLILTPKNETVNNNTEYLINCHAGGGEYADTIVKYFINDIQVIKNRPFNITNDTKIECRAVSGEDKVSVVAYIIVRRKGTEEDKFLQLECTKIKTKVCDRFLLDDYSRFSNIQLASRKIAADLLERFFSILDSSITLEYEEEKCIDRFKRFICSTFYPRCDNTTNESYVKVLNCRESCESIFYVICRNALHDIRSQISSQSQQFINAYVEKNPFSQSYVSKFISNLTNSILNCDQLPQKIGSSSHSQCDRVNLDISPADKSPSEKKCFNNIGRNYVGQYSISDLNSTKCVNWSLLPQLYVSFHQQNLENQSNYCRNPGGIYQRPVCAINLKKSNSIHIENIRLIVCTNLPLCKTNELKYDPMQGKTNIIMFSAIGVVVFVIIIIVIAVKCFAKVRNGIHKKIYSTENIPLNEDEVHLFPNLVYKHSLNGGFECPIYNAAHFEKVQALAVGEYGEIVLVQAVIDNTSSLVLDKGFNSNSERLQPNKRPRSARSISESDIKSIDDLILSVEKTFNEKPCWPFDKSSPSGSCPFAVIKYLNNADNDQKEARFNKETKILSQMNHPNILRFYGVCLHISKKVTCRIVEYLPNGDIKSILTGTRREPPKSSNHENNNKIRNGYQTVYALQKSRSVKTDSHNSSEESKFFKWKNASNQTREIERPQPAENIDLTYKQLVQWGFEICDAIVYLHTKHLIHRDIATRNCLVGMNLEAKLSDFSFVQKFSYGFDLIGNPNEYIPIRWLPKETLENLIFNTDTDVWMFGVYLWELMSFGKEPYCEYDLHEVYEAIVSDKILEIPENCPLEIYEQMKMCFAPSRQRPCLDIVKNNLMKICDKL